MKTIAIRSMQAAILIISAISLGGCSGDTGGESSSSGSSDPWPPSSSGSPGSSGSSGSSQTTSSGSPGACTEGELECVGADTINACENGEVSSYSCTDVCDELGFTSDGCAKNLCQCGDPNDSECYNGTLAFCACVAASGGTPCTNNDYSSYYVGCHQGLPDYDFIWCFDGFSDGSQVDCSSAAQVCL